MTDHAVRAPATGETPAVAPAAGSALPDPVLFVGGAPRSGTTLLRNMLAAHPLIAVPDESYFIHDLRRDLAGQGRLDDVGLAWELIREHRFFKGWGLGADAVERVLATHPPTSYADLLRAMFAAYAASQGKPLSADKTPANSQAFVWLAALFPTSRMLHLVRDPREVCMSLALKPWNPWGMSGAADEWAKHVGPALAEVDALGDRALEVRYEQLVSEPEAELERICDFAGVPFDRVMLGYAGRADVLPGLHHARAREAPVRGARRWEGELSDNDLAVIEAFSGDLMDRIGYARATHVAALRGVALVGRHRAIEIVDWWVRRQAPALGRGLRRVGQALPKARFSLAAGSAAERAARSRVSSDDALVARS